MIAVYPRTIKDRNMCYSLCVASILELPIDSVPRPREEGAEWIRVWDEWYRERGLVAYQFSKDFQASGYSIALGKWNGIGHAVVQLDGLTVYDPNINPYQDEPVPWPIDAIQIIVPRDPAVLFNRYYFGHVPSSQFPLPFSESERE